MHKVGDLVWYMDDRSTFAAYELGVGIVTQASTTAEQSGLLKGKGLQGRAIYRVHWQKRPVPPACTGWLFAHQLVSATKQKQLPKQ